ncbi:MAG TPA: 1-(5-phosphoribosyl)-5-[(5-phosphoribosylamino)methylideneamino]imidazole-4-carboxamide isomerase [Thermoleophilaceae bacterium]|nr:1-(5-phosphoribosyl)-5-[(5-phosphoribosylamino)methylideneamino]imidazole-4-carboxamide isomerase [Thermoleophilaceae bacterium]
MIFLPAVDIRDGKAVRLRQGRYEEETVYADDPLEAARSFVTAGATFLHVVDLDGARTGEPANLHHLERIKAEFHAYVQYGGGLRSMASIGAALAAGADRVVVGTAAIKDPELLEQAVWTWDRRVLVAVDVRGGRVSVDGWTRRTDARPETLVRHLGRKGVSGLIYTNVDRDGMLAGPDVDEIERIARVVRGQFLYSGGIGSLEHLRALRDLRLDSLAGVISGKALYEGRFGVREAQDALRARI